MREWREMQGHRGNDQASNRARFSLPFLDTDPRVEGIMNETNERAKLLAIIKKLDDRVKLLESRERNQVEENEKLQKPDDKPILEKWIPPSLVELDQLMH